MTTHTRILGLTGYKPDKTFAIKTLGGFTVDTTQTPTDLTGTTDPSTLITIASGDFYADLSGVTAHDGQTITEYVVDNNTGLVNGNWFVIGLVPSADTSSLTASLEMTSPLTGLVNSTNQNGKEWINVLNNGVDEVYSYLFVYNNSTSEFEVTQYTWSADLLSDYDEQIVVSFRSRGSYTNQTLNLEVTATTHFEI